MLKLQPARYVRRPPSSLLTHGGLCFTPCAWRATSHCREADIVVGSVLGWRVRHGGVAGTGLWLWRRSLSLGWPPSAAAAGRLPRGEVPSCVWLPGSCMLRRRRRPWWRAHCREGRGSSSRSGGFTREARTAKASTQISYVSERVQSVWLGLVGGSAVDWACGTSGGRPTAHAEATSWKKIW